MWRASEGISVHWQLHLSCQMITRKHLIWGLRPNLIEAVSTVAQGRIQWEINYKRKDGEKRLKSERSLTDRVTFWIFLVCLFNCGVMFRSACTARRLARLFLFDTLFAEHFLAFEVREQSWRTPDNNIMYYYYYMIKSLRTSCVLNYPWG